RDAQVRHGKALDLADTRHARHEPGPEGVQVLADGGHRAGAGDRDGSDTGRESRCHRTHPPVSCAVTRSAIPTGTKRPVDVAVTRTGRPDRRGGRVSARAGSASTRWNRGGYRAGALALPQEDAP